MICLGYGEGKCTNVAGCQFTPYWCAECDKMRRAAITKQMEDAERQFERKINKQYFEFGIVRG